VQSRWAISAFAQLSSNRQCRMAQQARSAHAQAPAGLVDLRLLVGPEPAPKWAQVVNDHVVLGGPLLTVCVIS
jgi:hypothetical protein